MAKEQTIQIIWIVLLMSVVTVVVNLFIQTRGSGEASGILIAKVNGNTIEIKRVDESGSKIMQEVRIDLSQLLGRTTRNELDIVALETSVERKFDTIIRMLERQ